jgi:hypothetical protein
MIARRGRLGRLSLASVMGSWQKTPLSGPMSMAGDIARLPSHRDRALVAFYVSARASELLSATSAGIDSGRQLITVVVRKGTRELQEFPASTDAFVWLRLYPCAPWRIRIDQQFRDRITAHAPAGWGRPRRSPQSPRDRPPDRVAQGPARRAQRRPGPPRAVGRACASRWNTASLDCLTHPAERQEQCAPCSTIRM